VIAVLLLLGTSLLLVGLAVPLLRRKVPPNALYGLRVPQTLEHPDVWYEANARSARDLLRLGAVLTLVAAVGLVLPPSSRHLVMVPWSLVLVIGTVVYAIRGVRIARAVTRELQGPAGDDPSRGSLSG